MNQNADHDSGPQAAAQERAHARTNPQPRRSHEIILSIENAPGPFAVVKGSAQYDVVNRNECGRIDTATGTVLRMSEFAPVVLHRVSDTEYRGTVYLDQLQDEDYYGRGVCRWELTAVSAVLRATGAAGETSFEPTITAGQVAAADSVVRYFWTRGYPRSEMDGYPDAGEATPDAFRPDIRNELFKVTLKAQGMQP